MDLTTLNNVFVEFTNGMIDYREERLRTEVITDELNKLFPEKICIETIYTKNIDKLFFGVYVAPTLTAEMTMQILLGDEPVSINRYKVEIDSKLFDSGLSAEEITAYLIYEVSAMIDGTAPVENVRSIIDSFLACKDEVIDINQSANYTQIFTFAIKDALNKVSSIMYQDADGVLSNSCINELGLRDFLISGLNKVRSAVFGIGAEIREPNLVLIEWAFFIYKDAKRNANMAIDTLEQSKLSTASVLRIAEVDKTIKSLQRVEYEITMEATKLLTEGKKKGFFGGLKASGLRSIEDDLYEFTIRVRTAETEEEAFYALRQINSRLAILEDYVYEHGDELSELEREKWVALIRKYRQIRDELSQKKLAHNKTYGLFYDYDKLDELDK